VFSTYNLPHALNHQTLAELARWMMTMRDADRARELPPTVTDSTPAASPLPSSAPASAAVSSFSLDTGLRLEY
jgi:hypothetical protein